MNAFGLLFRGRELVMGWTWSRNGNNISASFSEITTYYVFDVAGHVWPPLPQGCSGGVWILKEARPV